MITTDAVLELEWASFAERFLLVPLCAQIAIMVILVPVSRLWMRCKFFENWFISQYVGSQFFKPKRPGPYTFLKFLQLVCSVVSVVTWVVRTYEKDQTFCLTEVSFLPVFILAWLADLAQKGFHPMECFDAANIIDVFTISPTFAGCVCEFESQIWLTTQFLRVYPAMDAYHDIERSGFEIPFTEYTRQVLLMLLRALSLITILSGITFCLEVLGELPFLRDRFIETPGGELSVLQMLYWTFTTVSTVGYGDWAPKTVLGRTFCCVAIVVGVTFFTIETGRLSALSRLEDSGLGEYGAKKHIEHVVIVGGGVTEPGQILYSLLEELFTQEEQARWPDVVLLGRDTMPEVLKSYMDAFLPPHVHSRIYYFKGTPMRARDLERVRADCARTCYVIADACCRELDTEDAQNLLRALSVLKKFPSIDLRLMLMKESTRHWAINSGISPDHCFCVQGLKARCIAHSVRCHGFSTLITNLLNSDDMPDTEMGVEPWMIEYCEGSNNSIYGSTVHHRCAGRTWRQFVFELYQKSGAVCFAAQIDGEVRLNPGQQGNDPLYGGEVFFCIASDPEDIGSPTDRAHWADAFHHARRLKRTTTYFGCKRSVASTRKTHGGALRKTYVGRKKSTNHSPHDSMDSLTSSQGRSVSSVYREFTNTIEKIAPDILKSSQRCLLEQLETNKNHIVVVACGPEKSNWGQIEVLLLSLRDPLFELEHRPVVVLAKNEPPSELRHEQPDVMFVQGDPLSLKDLAAAHTTSAACVILFTDAAPAQYHNEFKDQNVVVVVNAIESLLLQVDQPVFPLYDLMNADSAGFLTDIVDKNFEFDQSNYLSSHHSEDGGKDGGKDSHKTWKKHMELWREALRTKTRFGCGQVFTLNFIGGMLGREYYVPCTMEVLQTLVICSGQSSLPWLVPVPKQYHGRSYLSLLEDWTVNAPGMDVATPLGVRRSLAGDEDKGLERAFGYVITNPYQEFKLMETDEVYVLASTQWAHRNLSEKLGLTANKEPPWRTSMRKSLANVRSDSAPQVIDNLFKSLTGSLDQMMSTQASLRTTFSTFLNGTGTRVVGDQLTLPEDESASQPETSVFSVSPRAQQSFVSSRPARRPSSTSCRTSNLSCGDSEQYHDARVVQI